MLADQTRPSHPRTAWVDALRGIAVVWMIAYHFCFDLNWYGWANWHMLSDPFWTLQRAAIVGLFMFTAGLAQVLAWRGGQSPRAFWRRWAQIAACAVLVSVASWWSFPNSWIYFGVLHAYALMWLLTRALARLAPSTPMWAALGLCVWLSAWWMPHLLSGTAVQSLFNTAPANLLGWVSQKPLTQDYAPLAPWWGVLLLGVAAGQWWWSQGRDALRQWQATSPLGRLLCRLGRQSLWVYMLHQPIMLMGFEAVRWAMSAG